MSTFLTWTPDASAPRGIRLADVALIDCPGCGEPCGHLYRDADTPAGECLGCRLREDFEDEAAAEVWEAGEEEFSFWDRCDEVYDRWVDSCFA